MVVEDVVVVDDFDGVVSECPSSRLVRTRCSIKGTCCEENLKICQSNSALG